MNWLLPASKFDWLMRAGEKKNFENFVGKFGTEHSVSVVYMDLTFEKSCRVVIGRWSGIWWDAVDQSWTVSQSVNGSILTWIFVSQGLPDTVLHYPCRQVLVKLLLSWHWHLKKYQEFFLTIDYWQQFELATVIFMIYKCDVISLGWQGKVIEFRVNISWLILLLQNMVNSAFSARCLLMLVFVMAMRARCVNIPNAQNCCERLVSSADI